MAEPTRSTSRSRKCTDLPRSGRRRPQCRFRTKAASFGSTLRVASKGKGFDAGQLLSDSWMSVGGVLGRTASPGRDQRRECQVEVAGVDGGQARLDPGLVGPPG